MKRFDKLKQAYPHLPWRGELQKMGMFLVGIVLFLLVSIIYLNVSAKTAGIGREIQSYQATADAIEQENEDYKSELASLSSSRVLEKRSEAMDFRALDPDEALYVYVPGYKGRRPLTLAPSQESTIVRAHVMPDEYTESLFQWIYRKTSPYLLPLLGVEK